MSAYMELHVALCRRLDAKEAYRLAFAYEAEALRKQAADLRRIEREDTPAAASGVGEGLLRAALILDERADQLDTVREKATAPAATSTPAGPLGAGARNRLALLRRAVVDNSGEWTTRRAQRLYANTYGPGDWRATARRDLKQLHADGLLVEHDDNPDRHHYTVNTRKDGGS